MTTTAKSKKQKPGFSFHLTRREEQAVRYLVNNRKYPRTSPQAPTAHPFSIRLGVYKLALTQLARDKGLDYEIVNGGIVFKAESGWLILIRAALEQYFDREVPNWSQADPPRSGGSKAGWTAIVKMALDEYLDCELPGWRSDLMTD